MNVTYLNHSGFLLEWDDSYWLFDYFKGEIPTMNPNKDIYVFTSHSHHDHFNQEIFELLSTYPKVKYIFADEMKEECGKLQTPEILFLKNHTDTELNHSLKIHTLASTDLGCAFVIEYKNHTVYHAGDLHWWYWDGEDPAWNEQMTADYKKEMEYLKGKQLDLVMTPLDPRQGNEYALGMNYLLEIASVKHVFPMHFWDDFSIINRYLCEYKVPENTKFHSIEQDGEKMEVFYEV